MTPHDPHNGKGGAFAGLTALARKVGSFLMKLYTVVGGTLAVLLVIVACFAFPHFGLLVLIVALFAIGS